MSNKLHNAIESDAFLEASQEELRVLIALKECPALGTEELATVCSISRARASSAVRFWQEAGILSDIEKTPTISSEFEERLRLGEIDEEPSKKVAKDIRDNGLSLLISECASLMKKSALNTTEIKKLTALSTQYALSDEYILTLSAYLAEKGKLTVTRLTDEALKLVGRDIDNCEALEEYIKNCREESGIEKEFKKAFAIYDRALSQKEKAYFRKWSKEYGYFTEIVGAAHDICIDSISKRSFPYIDRVLTGWYNAGCRTVSACLEHHEKERLKRADAQKKKSAAAKAKREEAKKPRYGDFDINDVFKSALERSYGKDDEEQA